MGVDQRNLDVVIEGEDGQDGGKADWRVCDRSSAAIVRISAPLVINY